MVLLVPSRRPAGVARLINSLLDTCHGETHLVIGVDEDDPAREQYPVPWIGAPFRYEVHPGLRQVVAWINHLAVTYAPHYDAVGTVGDDNVFLTPGWDLAVADALGRTPFAFGNDLYPRPPGSLCCHIFCRSEVVKRLGFLGPRCLRHMYVDPVWMAWGKAAGITYLNEVIIEHLHYTNGKSPYDLSYAASSGFMGPDQEAYRQYCRSGQLNADIRVIDPAARQYTAEELEVLTR